MQLAYSPADLLSLSQVPTGSTGASKDYSKVTLLKVPGQNECICLYNGRKPWQELPCQNNLQKQSHRSLGWIHKTFLCELWAKVPIGTQGITPPSKRFSCSASHGRTLPSSEVTKKNMQSHLLPCGANLVEGLTKVGLNWNSRVRAGAKILLLLLILTG